MRLTGLAAARVAVTGVAVLALVAGCGGAGPAGPGGPGTADEGFAERAREVAAAWQSSTAAGVWRTGFVPLQDLTVPPADGFPDDDSKQAFLSGWYVLRTTLPDVVTGQTRQVRFPDGSTMPVGVVPATEAYAAIDRGDPPCSSPPPTPQAPAPSGPDAPAGTGVPGTCRPLAVTAATFGEVPLRTSRGEATVPAWLFTTAGLAQPVARVAVAPAQVTPLPSPPVPPAPHRPGLVTAQDLVAVDGAAITYRLGVGACDTDIRPLVHETDAVVVVGGRVTPPTSGACIDLLELEPVTVTLAAPLGDRPVVDATNGTALTMTIR